MLILWYVALVLVDVRSLSHFVCPLLCGQLRPERVVLEPHCVQGIPQDVLPKKDVTG